MQKNDVEQLAKKIKHYKELYYQGHPEITDGEFDELEEKLAKLCPDHYVLSLVGSSPKGANKVKHATKMLSLDKTYISDDLKSWIAEHEVVSMFKLDGVSCSLLYDKGRLNLAKTRGDGSEGENITKCVQWIEDIPKSVSIDYPFEIRGELYCKEEDFIHLSNSMSDRGLEKPTSQRNIVAGLMSRKDNIDLSKFISFMAFDFLVDGKNLKFKKESDKLKMTQKIGFTCPDFVIHKDLKKIDTRLEEAQTFMSEGNFQIDGLVFVYEDLNLQSDLGETSHHPKYKMAFKFKGESKEAVISSIEWGVSRNGILTPVAKIEPVELSGAVITNVTLHNWGMAKQYDLKKGDKIEIIRSGEVIPKFLSVIKSNPKEKFTWPKNCPSCQSQLVVEDIRLFCKNLNCPDKVLSEILNFVQKIGIEDISEKRLLEMYNKGLIKEIDDLYKITVEDLLTLDKTKEKLANKIFDNIQKTKHVDIKIFLSSLGISGGAYNKCEKIVDHGYNTIEKIKNLNVEELTKVESFAEKSATDFLASLKSKHKLIDRLIKLGVKIEQPQEHRTTQLHGLSFCITGELSKPRGEVSKMIKLAGGKVLSSVSKNLDYLVTNEEESNSSKFKKAIELNVKIINEKKLNELLNG